MKARGVIFIAVGAGAMAAVTLVIGTPLVLTVAMAIAGGLFGMGLAYPRKHRSDNSGSNDSSGDGGVFISSDSGGGDCSSSDGGGGGCD